MEFASWIYQKDLIRSILMFYSINSENIELLVKHLPGGLRKYYTKIYFPKINCNYELPQRTVGPTCHSLSQA